ncbi:cyclopropane-fatty-acyl-phospholipid synthase family protein [Alteromonas sp. ASW11-36]|uniref:Cyclopropane-fatty-acyl-phospholipid synthase family protein n=1 Tax=Alteromonas arenosi TaxID=3055817 RepID=A0ABT7SW47_9ALTE|nr:cyclopropane-fatty-acyl-phospholipid synthase family protein [Alteromonas sp. ASW11-36]MDM7859787.1 cyclopropane-fatty-acyl-phospholipid synthase family protein [Alteromonas sp. ASW11-36]
MSHGEHAIAFEEELNWVNRTCKAIFLNVLSTLPHGQITIKERGTLVAAYGDANSDLKAEVDIQSPVAYKHLLVGGSVASGETYTDGLWTTPNLTNVIRIFARNLDTLDQWEAKFKWLSMPVEKIRHLMRRNSQEQAKKNISAHYDLGNKLYTRFLDESMMYSSAIYPDVNSSLADAQIHKLKSICDKLQLNANDHLLEIGTGWGGLAVFAAKHYGCKVTTTTISEEQFAFAKDWVKREGLESRITLLKKDYRLLEGSYDKLVSIEMIEAVGKEYMANFFSKCSSLLKQSGLMVIQAITIDDRRYETYSKGVDFIQKHIFPGGFLPSQLIMNKTLKEHTDMMIRDLHDIGLDYARTLNDWYIAFQQSREALTKDGYDERFARMWQYYLNYCEGGFLERTISTVQLIISKPGFKAPITR